MRVPELSGAEGQRDYYIRFVCPRCFRSRWVLKRNLALTLEQVSNTFWQFECPVHGPLCEKPLEASEKNPQFETKRPDPYACRRACPEPAATT